MERVNEERKKYGVSEREKKDWRRFHFEKVSEQSADQRKRGALDQMEN